MNSVIDAVNILKSTYQKHLAESISINTNFFLFVLNQIRYLDMALGGEIISFWCQILK